MKDLNNLKINHNYIENIWNKLQASTNIVSNPKDYVQDSWGLYIVHCELLKNHEYLKIGKANDLRNRIVDGHMSGKNEGFGKSILNTWLSRDNALRNELNIDLTIQSERISFISNYCYFQILVLERKDRINCMQIEADNNLYLQYQDYWGINKGRDPIEYIEKPIEKVLKDNNMVRYIRGSKLDDYSL